MQAPQKSKAKTEFGDFQTPPELARQCCALLRERGFSPASVLEPTCGRGNFLTVALEAFPDAGKAIGLEINPAHVEEARQQIQCLKQSSKVEIHQTDFFRADWDGILRQLADPLLIVGNPPWVTNSQLGALESENLPRKSNFQNLAGLDALTGKSNFDISEWMLLRALEWMNGRRAILAMLCKTATARKALFHAWKQRFQIAQSDLYRIDAAKHFGAAVDACWLIVEMSPNHQSTECYDHSELRLNARAQAFGLRSDRLIADLEAYDKCKPLMTERPFAWRSGVKHDCSKVLELERAGEVFRNGLDERVDLEPDYLYPMLKSSDVATEGEIVPRRWMLVSQQSIGEETRSIRHHAPKTWQYLIDHAEMLDARASSIYKGRPRFSVFGVGGYSFTDWKVGISGFYKKLSFRVVGPYQGKPVVFDDTCCFLACRDQAEADTIANLLNSEKAKHSFAAFIFWDAKRPITVDVLKLLDLVALAEELDVDVAMIESLRRLRSGEEDTNQLSLFSN
jgi:hypothetical protein